MNFGLKVIVHLDLIILKIAQYLIGISLYAGGELNNTTNWNWAKPKYLEP